VLVLVWDVFNFFSFFFFFGEHTALGEFRWAVLESKNLSGKNKFKLANDCLNFPPTTSAQSCWWQQLWEVAAEISPLLWEMLYKDSERQSLVQNIYRLHGRCRSKE